MTDDLVLYTNPQSRGRIVRRMLEEVGAPYRTETVAYGPAMKSHPYRALNPMGKVPTLVHKGTVITEVAAICAYLADAFPAAGLAPAPGDALRGPYYRWLFFAAGPVEAAVTNRALNVEVPPERAGMVGYGSLDLVLDVLADAVRAGPFLLGERFSAADVYVGSHIGFGLRFGSFAPREEFVTYLSRLEARPAWVRAAALDDALMG